MNTNNLKQIAFIKDLKNANNLFTIERGGVRDIFHPAKKEAYLTLPDKCLDLLLASNVFYGN